MSFSSQIDPMFCRKKSYIFQENVANDLTLVNFRIFLVCKHTWKMHTIVIVIKYGAVVGNFEMVSLISGVYTYF